MPAAYLRTAPAELLADLRRARAACPEDLRQTLRRWNLRPLDGGRQNYVYARADHEGSQTCIKIYRADDRQRPDREWTALTMLADQDIEVAPAPLWIDPSPDQPAIGMTLLDGTPLLDLDAPGRDAALKGLAHTTRRLQAIPLTGLLASLDRIDSASHYTRRLTQLWPAQLAGQPADPLTADMHSLLAAWHDSGDAGFLARPSEPVFSRGDANLLNWLRNGSASACVDFEFSGRSSTAFDAADLIEHISARAIPDSTWISLLPELGVTDASRPLFRAAQRTCALRWLAVLWKQRHHRAGEFEVQRARVRLLQNPDTPWTS